MYSKEFINLVNKAFSESEKLTPEEKAEGNPYYIGFGNPNAKILFIGKEKGFDIDKFNTMLFKEYNKQHPVKADGRRYKK